MIKARVYVTIKQGVLDPQGRAVAGALASLGFADVSGVRVGKFLEIDVATDDRDRAAARVKEMCDGLLANPVIEDYRFELERVGPEGPDPGRGGLADPDSGRLDPRHSGGERHDREPSA